MRRLLLICMLVGCAADRTESSTKSQDICTAGDGCSWTVAEVRAAQRDWIREEYPGAVFATDSGCSRFTQGDGRSGTECYVSITYYGHELAIVCDGYDDGEFTCDEGWD